MNCLLVIIAFNIFGVLCSARTVIASWGTEGLESVWFYTTKHPRRPIQRYVLKESQKQVQFEMDDPNKLEGAGGKGDGKTFTATITDPIDKEETTHYIWLDFYPEGDGTECIIC